MKINNRMFTNGLKKKVLSGLLAGTAAVMLMASPYMPVSAYDTTTAQTQQAATEEGAPGPHDGHQKGPQQAMTERIATMVKNGKITQDQADKLEVSMKAFHEKQGQEMKAWRDNLPNETGISQDTLKEIFKRPHHQRMSPEQMKQRMAQLVQDGKVTQTEMDALQTYFQNHKPDKSQAQKGEKKDPKQMMQNISSETGISTDRLQEIMHMMMPPKGPGPEQKMAKLVQDGKVTQAEADALSNFHKNHKPDGQKGQKPNKEEALQTMASETGISTDRLQEIMKMMRPMRPQPQEQPENNA